MEQTGFRVLVVDDSLLNQAVLRNILTAPDAPGEAGSAPFIMDSANSGPEALELLKESTPDLILLDIIMPGMSGFDVLKALKEDERTRPIPVVVITGLADEENEEQGLLLGASDYIVKPFKKTIVLARIRNQRRIVEQMRIIERFALYDTLTEALNRRGFDLHSEKLFGYAARSKEPVSAIMIDVDNFKKYNDVYGHQQGDLVLKKTANVIASELKRSTDMLFRWGGEEFVVLLANTPTGGAETVAERIRSSVEVSEVPYLGEERPPNVTASLGVATVVPDSSQVTDDLIKRADKAMYDAKSTGKNRVCVY